MNPYDLTAGPFLVLYVILLAVCFLVALRVRTREGRLATPGSTQLPDPLELAYLAGGNPRVVDTAMVALMESGAAELDAKAKTVAVRRPPSPLPGYLTPFHEALSLVNKVSTLGVQTRGPIGDVRDRLAARGLAYSPAAGRRRARMSGFAMWLLAVFGMVRVYLGHQRGHPIGYILILTLVALLTSLLLMAIKPRTREAGRLALRASRERNSRAARAPLDSEIALAVALTGAAALSGTPYEAFAQMRAAASGGDGSSACGSGGGGDGGGGCGGCGGGH